jgi:hypothetical protein
MLRTARHHLRIVALCLALGAAVNVGLCWRLAWGGHPAERTPVEATVHAPGLASQVLLT